jgi:hypothetical protein
MPKTVIMGDCQDGFAGRPEFGQECLIEESSELWVLVGGPFIEHDNWPVVQEGDDESEAFALSGGEVGVREPAFDELRFVGNVHLFKPVIDRCGVDFILPVESVKEMEIREDDREELPVVLIVVLLQPLAVQPELPAIELVEAADDFHERGFAATIAANEKDRLATPDVHVERPDREQGIVLGIAIGELEAVPGDFLKVQELGWGLEGPVGVCLRGGEDVIQIVDGSVRDFL